MDLSKDRRFYTTAGQHTPDRPASSIFGLLIEINKLLFVYGRVTQPLIQWAPRVVFTGIRRPGLDVDLTAVPDS